MKKILAAIAMALVGITASAAIEFEVPTMTPFVGYASAKTDAAVFRQSATETSKKLIVNCVPDTDLCDLAWAVRGDAVHPDEGDAFGVLGYSADGTWMNIMYAGFLGSEPVWVKSSLMEKKGAPESMDATMMERSFVYPIGGGNYVWLNYDVNDMDESPELWLGKKVGEEYVMCYKVTMPEYREEQRQSIVTDPNYEYAGNFAVFFNDSRSCTRRFYYPDGYTYDQECSFDPTKVTEGEWEMIFGEVMKEAPEGGQVVNSLGHFPIKF